MNAIRKLEGSLTSAIRLDIPTLIQVRSTIRYCMTVLYFANVNQSLWVQKRCLRFSEEQLGTEVFLPKMLFDILDFIVMENARYPNPC